MSAELELAQLEALVAAIDHGSFVAASRALSIPSSSLRARLASLEETVGAPLLVRSNRGARPTEAGERLARRARALLAEAEQMLVEVKSHAHEPLGEIHVRLPTGPSPFVIQVVLQALRARFPQLRVRLDTRADPLAELDASVDVVVHFGELVAGGPFRTVKLRVTALRLMATAAYLEAHRRPETPQDLHDHALLMWTPHSAPTDALPVIGGEPVEVLPALSCADVSVVHAATAAGLGVGWLPEAFAGFAGRALTPLQLVLEDQVTATLEVRVLVPLRAASTARARAVLEVLAAVVAELTPGQSL